MRDLEIAQVDEITLAASDPLERNKITKRTDRRLDTIDSPQLSTSGQLVKAEWRDALGE